MMEWCGMVMDREKMKEIEKKVSDLLEKYGYHPEVDSYLDIVRFAQWKGFTVGNARLSESEDGFIVIRPDYDGKGAAGRWGPKVIGVNRELDGGFKRFVVAHELGHEALHYDGAGLYRHREDKSGKTPEEREREEAADYFAAALLMPLKSFRRRYDELRENGMKQGETCIRLSRDFGVPLESVLRRVDELEEITA